MTEPASKNRTWLYVGVVFALFWAVYLIFFNPSKENGGIDSPALSPPALPLPADYGWKLEDLEGNAVDLAQFRGRPIVLNIWATWCGPCVMEMPSLARLAATPSLKNVAFLCVTNEPASAGVKSFAQTNMRGLQVLRANSTPEVFATDGIPATFIIGPDGKVVAAEVGATKWDAPNVVELLERLLKSQPPPKS